MTNGKVKTGGKGISYAVAVVATGLFFLAGSAGVLSTVPQAKADTQTHVFKFYIDSGLVPDMAFARSVLPKYVADMNYVLGKNTNRQFSFDPQTGIVLTSTDPLSHSAGALPASGYEVWAYIMPATQCNCSYGGNMSFDVSGAAGLDNLHWLKLYDPDALTANTPDMQDYWTQVDHMLHEFAHVSGAGSGEYYTVAQSQDVTGVDPASIIDVNNPTDPFWNTKPDFYPDPLLHLAYNWPIVGSPTSRAQLLQTVRYSNVTAAQINGMYRAPTVVAPMPDMLHIVVQAVDAATGLPVPGANIKMWRVRTFPPYDTLLLDDMAADANGQIVVPWGEDAGGYLNNFNNLRLVKVHADGYGAAAKYYSAYDAQTVKLVNGSDQVVISVPLFQDTTPPTSAITAPAAGASVGGIVNVTATASDNLGVSKVELYVDGTLLSTDTISPYTFGWDTAGAVEGSHTLQTKAYDTTGNTGNSAPVSVTVDHTNPTAAITAPAGGAFVSGQVPITIAAADNIAVTKVELYVDGSLYAAGSSAPYNFSWDSGPAADGNHTLQAKAYDAAGNAGSSAIVNVTVSHDTAPPATSLTAPANGATVSGTVAVSASATDNIGVTKVEFYKDNVLLATDTSSPYSVSWNTATEVPGSHTLFSKAYDAAGNVGASATRTVTVKDQVAPAAAITSPVNNAVVTRNSTVTIAASASDDVGITKVEFYVNNSLKCTDTASPYSCGWGVPAAKNTTYTLAAKAYDAAGNVGASSTVTVKSSN